MHVERLRVGNVRHLGDREHDFGIAPRRLRKWNLLAAGASSSALLRALALVSLGQRQVRLFTRRFSHHLAAQADRPVQLECVQVRHAPQERLPTSPARRPLAWQIDAGACISAWWKPSSGTTPDRT